MSPSALYFEPLVRRSEHEFFAGNEGNHAGSLRGELGTGFELLCPSTPLYLPALMIQEKGVLVTVAVTLT